MHGNLPNGRCDLLFSCAYPSTVAVVDTVGFLVFDKRWRARHGRSFHSFAPLYCSLAVGECLLQEMEKVYLGRLRPAITFCSFSSSLLSVVYGALYTLSFGGLSLTANHTLFLSRLWSQTLSYQ
jgi:hypothetical protein